MCRLSPINIHSTRYIWCWPAIPKHAADHYMMNSVAALIGHLNTSANRPEPGPETWGWLTTDVDGILRSDKPVQ